MHGRWWMLGALLLAGSAVAQYKVVGPDGKVTYTDIPQPGAKATRLGAATAEGDAADDRIPFELRQVVSRYPVTLYTANGCSACDAARNLLRRRGVPYTEKTVNTPEDVTAFQRAEGGNELPVARVGGQQIKGYSESEWSSYLDAAGYPKTSQLPTTYKFRDPMPMSPLPTRSAAPSTPAQAPAQAPAAQPAQAPTPGNIRF